MDLSNVPQTFEELLKLPVGTKFDAGKELAQEEPSFKGSLLVEKTGNVTLRIEAHFSTQGTDGTIYAIAGTVLVDIVPPASSTTKESSK